MTRDQLLDEIVRSDARERDRARASDKIVRVLTRTMRPHSEYRGDLCVDFLGTGCCSGCGVSLDTCPTCRGVGYHRSGCEIDHA